MDRLKYLLVGLVVVLAAAVVYGFVDGGGDDGSDAASVATEAETDAPAGGSASEREQAPAEVPPRGAGEGTPGKPPAGGGSAAAPARGERGGEAGSRPDPAAGSGGSGSRPGEASGSGGGTGATSSAAFISRGNAICQELPRKMREQVERIQREAAAQGGPPDPQVLVRTAGAPVLREAANKFEAAVPAGDARARAIAVALAGAAKGFETATSAISPQGIRALAEFQRRARQYGLRSCRGF